MKKINNALNSNRSNRSQGVKKNCQEQTYSNKPLYTNKGQYTEEYGLRLTNKLKELTNYLRPYRVNYDCYKKYCLPQSQ